MTVFPSGVTSSVGGKKFPEVRVDKLNRSKTDYQQETCIQASKLYKLPKLGLRVPVGPTIDVNPGSKPSACSKVIRPVTQFKESYI